MRMGSQEARHSGHLTRLIRGRTASPEDRGPLQSRKVGGQGDRGWCPLQLLSTEAASAGTTSCRVTVRMNLKAGHEGSAMQVGCVKLSVVKTGFGERTMGDRMSRGGHTFLHLLRGHHR